MKKKITISILTVSVIWTAAFAQAEFEPDSIIGAARRCVSNHLRSTLGNFWQQGAYFGGVMALYYMTEDPAILDSVMAWGDYHSWIQHGDGLDDLDNIACEQAYLEAYLLDPVPGNYYMAEDAINDINYLCYTDPPGGGSEPRFAYVDIMFMAGPVYARAAVAADDPAIYDSLHVVWSNTANVCYDPRFQLYLSRQSYDSSDPDPEFWSRGNGWAIGSLSRILEYLPDDHPTRPYYETKLQEHCEGLLEWQDPDDGCWRSDITHPEIYSNKETSGTAFFCFGLLYALNNNIVDRETYEEPARKAWTGLLSCMRDDGRIGYSQPPHWAPQPAEADNVSDYTDGAFMMAAWELYKFVTGIGREPGFLFSPKSITFNSSQSGISSVQPQVLSIENAAPELDTFENVSASADVDWLDVSFNDNDGNEQEAVIGLNSNAEGLGLGTHTAKVEFSADNVETRSLNVELNITMYGENLVLNKIATSSSVRGGNSASNAVDGNTDTRWESEFEDNQWMMVDMDGQCSVEHIIITWQNAASEVYAIQISDDGENWTTIDSVSDGTSADVRELDVSGEGRYIRIYGYTRTTAYGHSIYEFEVYGSRAGTPVMKNLNVKQEIGFRATPSDMVFNLDRPEHVNVSLLTVNGRKVEVLYDGTVAAGRTAVPWESRRLSSGVYFLKIIRGDQMNIHKVLLGTKQRR